MKIVGEKEAYEDLANAIVVTAVQDYKHALVRLKRHPESESAKRDVERLEKFFFSEWYEMLTNLDPSFLIRKLKEAIDENMEAAKGGRTDKKEDAPCISVGAFWTSGRPQSAR